MNLATELNHPKTANTTHPVHELIRKRWSARAFADKPISEKDMHTIFEAASWAASAYNEQPWEYIYAHREDTEQFEKLLSCLNPGNAEWVKDAPVLMLSLARPKLSLNDLPNRHYFHDVGAANTNLLLQAADLDIYGHMMGGFDYQKTINTFNLDEQHTEPVCFITLGYLGEVSMLSESLQIKEAAARQRKSVQEFSKRLK